MTQAATHVIVTGRVQGVGFRAWLAREARARGLLGWVRNRADGSVEALIRGEAGAVEAMVGACRTGPRMAGVAEVVATAAPVADGASGFQIRDDG